MGLTAVNGAAVRWSSQLDFVGPRIRTSVWGWALLVLGLCAALASVDQLGEVKQETASAQDSLRRLQRAEHQHKLAATPARSASGPEQAWSSEAMASAQGVVGLLGYPWAPVLDRVEQAALQEQALLLSLNVDQDHPLSDSKTSTQVRVSAAVMDDVSALQWALALGDGAQLLARERLSTPAPSPQGDYAWRAEATWSGVHP